MRASPMLLAALTVVVTLLVTDAAGAQAEENLVSAGPWRSGFCYNIYTPHYGGQIPEVRRDTNFAGQPLTLDGRVYEHGFGCRGFSIVELRVPAGVTGLSARLGIDDQDTGSGNGTYFSVWADGEMVWRSMALTRDDPALLVTIPVRSATGWLKLVTDAQGYGNPDLADWCDVQWLRAAPPPQPVWRYAATTGWHVRPELHPFGLLYRGEALLVTVLGPEPGQAVLAGRVTSDSGRTVLETRQTVFLEPGSTAAALGRARLDMRALPNGIYDLHLTALAGGKPVAERTVRFGLLESRAGKPSQGTIFGINHHEFAASYEALEAIGCEYSRQWFVWAWIQPERGQWNWNWHDERMAEARWHNVKTIGVLGGLASPAWSSPANVEPGQVTTPGCPADMADWEAYVRAVATRYRGQIRVWESWSEIMGLAQSGRLGWSVAKYVDLHRRTYRILKEIDPENKVLLSADWLSFVGECLDAGLGDAFDGIVPHPYRPGDPPEAWSLNYSVHEMGNVGTVFETARRWLTEHGHPQAEVWATELGWAVSGRDWVTVPVATHGQYVPRSYQLAQASGEAANLSWHDFAHGMFGLADPTGVPRPALLAYAAMVPRLSGARLVRRLEVGGRLHALWFRRDDTDLLTLCAETGTDFAFLKPPRAMRLRTCDWYGNASPLDLPAAGRALAVDGRIQYLEADSLEGLEVTQRELVTLLPAESEVLAGASLELACSLRNDFGMPATFTVRPGRADGVVPAAAVERVRLAPGEEAQVRLALAVTRDAAPGLREIPVSVTVPGGQEITLRAFVRVQQPLRLTVRPFRTDQLGPTVTPVEVEVHNVAGSPLTGRLEAAVPEGYVVDPKTQTFSDLAGGGTRVLPVGLTATRPVVSTDALALRATCTDGAHAERTISLSPTIADRDGDGVADGWRLNPEGGPPERPNLAEASIETGDSEFCCQRITCTRFGGGWIILHRDRQDHITRGKRYRVTYRARCQGVTSLVGVAVYNIVPWESCGLQKEQRIGSDWETVTHEFTATRDSDDVRFEVYFMSVGTLWVEGLRLEELP
ncbi:MAG: hypothetical protein HPY69_06220 [Armatimonadetes bacterium]|nr:hypothetical protein [Armatimonadota bacterium]